jgi:hypothetical protein
VPVAIDNLLEPVAVADRGGERSNARRSSLVGSANNATITATSNSTSSSSSGGGGNAFGAKDQVQMTSWATHAARLSYRLAAEHLPELEAAGEHVLQVLGCYYEMALDKLKDTPLNDQQMLGLNANCFHLERIVAPALDSLLGGCRTQEYAKAETHVFTESMCVIKSDIVVRRTWQLSYALYNNTALPTEPTAQALELFKWLRQFRLRLANQTSADHAKMVLSLLLSHIVEAVRSTDDSLLWKHIASMSNAAAVQLALDLRWLQEAGQALQWSSTRLSRAIEALQQRVLLEYCASNSIKNPSSAFPPADWFLKCLHPWLEEVRKG